jgi:hypothetical protein
MTDLRYYNQLAQFFSLPLFREVASDGRVPDFMRYVLTNSGYIQVLPKKVTLGQLYETLYGFLKSQYRCEYVYKNALANKILLGRHSLKTSTLLTEFRTNNSKADAVVMNGTSSVYEIKTELDTLERLDGQISSYKKVFDKVYVVTHESKLPKLQTMLAEDVGIILLTDKYTLQIVRESQSHKDSVDSAVIFDCLRQAEYCEIISDEFGHVPDVPNSKLYSECKRLFSTLPSTVAHDGMVRTIKKRKPANSLNSLVAAVPHSLKLLCLMSGFKLSQRKTLLTALETVYVT